MKILHLDWDLFLDDDNSRQQHFDITFKADPVAIKAAYDLHQYGHVADVDTDDLNDAFRLTNHIDGNWCENEEVQYVIGPNVRSTSVGDILIDKDDNAWAVARVGFAPLKLK